MFERLSRRFRQTALGPVVVIWAFGYVLVDIFAALMGRTVPGVQFIFTLPFLVSGIALTLVLNRLRQRLQDAFPAFRWGGLAVALLGAASIQARLDLEWFSWLAHIFFPQWLGWADQITPTRFLTTMVLYLWTFCLSLTVIWAAGLSRRAEADAARAEQAEAEAARAEAEAARAEAAALRLQLNPHFLFNTLNSISSLVTLGRKDEAEAMIQGLGEFLRASLHADPMADVSLAEEIETVDAYLNLESARFGDRLTIDIDVAPGLSELPVPNFILQPLVENAIKHGVAAVKGAATLDIKAARDGDTLVLSVTNRSAPGAAAAEPRPGTRIGLANIRQRLAIRYHGRASLETGPIPDGWRAEIRLPR
jgi:signal transduction histidine kinase